MAIEPNNTTLEFETMLRRHLKNGGGPVAACAGFDLDAASAYLEGALGELTQTRYEAHLAGCPSCRRQMIELTRLSLAVKTNLSPTAAPPAPIGDAWWVPASRAAHAAIVKLKEQVGLFNWRWDWRIAGAAAATCAVVTAMLVVRPWNQADQYSQANQAEKLVAALPGEPAAAGQNQASNAEAVPIPTPESDAPGVTGVIDQPIVAKQEARIVAVPMPPKQIGPAETKGLQESLAALPQEARGRQAPPPPLPSSEPTKTIVADLAAAPQAMRGPLRSGAEAQAESVQLSLASEPVMAPRIAPSSDDNPMRSIALRERRSDARGRSDKSSPPEARPGWYDRVMGFMPVREAEKPAAKQPVQDDETINPLTRKFRDKSFRFDRGMWVDQSYKPEIMAWRMVRLSRNSKEYERLLAAEPELKEFSNLGPMIIVWRDKVYRISGQ